MKLTIMMVLASLVAGPAIAEDVTFVIPGGTKGLFMAQAVAHTEDLTRFGFNADIGAPGNTCGAAELVANSDHPSLFIWGSDFDASAVMGDGCPAPAFAAENVIAVGYNPVFVCTMDSTLDPLVGEHKLGVWLGVVKVQAAAVARLNTVAGSNLTPIPYDGSGAALTALTNGEVDVALLPRARASTVKESGGACAYMFANADQDANTYSLPEMYGESALNLTVMDVIVALNWDPIVARGVLAEVYNDPASAVSVNGKYNNEVPENVMELWNSAVAAFVVE